MKVRIITIPALLTTEVTINVTIHVIDTQNGDEDVLNLLMTKRLKRGSKKVAVSCIAVKSMIITLSHYTPAHQPEGYMYIVITDV